MDHDVAPGWHPEGEDGIERWWDGAAWTEHRRRSRYSNYVERDGKLTYTGRKVFPSGSDEHLRLLRQAQGWTFSAVALTVLTLILLIPLVMYKPGALIALVIVTLLVLIASLVPTIRASTALRQIRDQYLRNELYVPVGADGTPVTSIQPTPPNWPSASTPA